MVDGERRTDLESRERIAVLETQMQALLRQHDGMARDIKAILSTLSEAKGGWKMLLLVGGAGGVVGTFLTKWASTIAQNLPK